MKHDIAVQLRNKIIELETQFSNPNREYNNNNEIFKAVDVTPLSETVAIVTLKKNTGKQTHALFFYIKNFWIYFFPTDGHELGMYNYLNNKYRIYLEGFNFDKNFSIVDEKNNLKKWM